MENAFQVLECMRKALELFVLGLLLKITLMELSGGNGERPIQIKIKRSAIIVRYFELNSFIILFGGNSVRSNDKNECFHIEEVT